MSQENLEIVRASVEAWKRGEAQMSLMYLHPEVSLDLRFRPDGKVWYGREGWRRGMAEWVHTWTNWKLEVERCIEAGDDRVVVLWREEGQAKASGVPMSEAGVTVTTLRDGLIISSVLSLDRERVLAELGVEH